MALMGAAGQGLEWGEQGRSQASATPSPGYSGFANDGTAQAAQVAGLY